MGLDWNSVGWPEYQLHLAGWNEAHRDPKEKGSSVANPDRLRRFLEAHTVH